MIGLLVQAGVKRGDKTKVLVLSFVLLVYGELIMTTIAFWNLSEFV